MVTETHRKLIDNFYKLEAENKRLREALGGARGDLVLLQMAIEHEADDTELLSRVALMELDMKKALLHVPSDGGSNETG